MRKGKVIVVEFVAHHQLFIRGGGIGGLCLGVACISLGYLMLLFSFSRSGSWTDAMAGIAWIAAGIAWIVLGVYIIRISYTLLQTALT